MHDQDANRRYFSQSSMAKLASQFDDLATGRIQVPRVGVRSTFRDAISDADVAAYHDLMASSSGPLFSHFLASIPCMLEEMSRVGTAIIRHAQMRAPSRSAFFEIDAFDGTNGRTLSRLSEGMVRTLTCSPNPSNEEYFYRQADLTMSRFHNGSFLTVNRSVIDQRYEVFSPFEGFDYIYETAAFQFYDINRSRQLHHVLPLLKEDGLLILLEKFNHPDPREYQHREDTKDRLHKSIYFTEDEIKWKRQKMLTQMNSGQVTLESIYSTLASHFRYLFIIWNSTNFYEIVSSNSEKNINEFIDLLGPALIDNDFVFETNLPKNMTTIIE